MNNILVNGTFDILHVGHIKLLEYAKSLGGYLTVAIDSDARVTLLKGARRPINNSIERTIMLNAIKPVDKVVVFDSDQDLIRLIEQCDILVKGSDYKDCKIIGQEYCKQLVFFERLHEYSTTQKIENIINRR